MSALSAIPGRITYEASRRLKSKEKKDNPVATTCALLCVPVPANMHSHILSGGAVYPSKHNIGVCLEGSQRLGHNSPFYNDCV